MSKLVIIGHGGMSRELHQWVLDINAAKPTFDFLGFLDDTTQVSRVPGCRVLGPISMASEMDGVMFAIALNTPRDRQRVVESLAIPNERWADIIHPTAVKGGRCLHGPGLVLFPNTTLSCDIQLGCHVQMNSMSGVGHDAILGNYCSLGPGSFVLGHAKLGERVFLGTNAVVLPGADLGDDVTIGACSTAMRHVKAGVTLFGVPGRRLS